MTAGAFFVAITDPPPHSMWRGRHVSSGHFACDTINAPNIAIEQLFTFVSDIMMS